MNITLNLEQQKFIQSQIKKGRYVDSQEVINKALELLEKQEQGYEQWLSETRQKVQVGIEQLERGEKIDGEVAIAQLQDKLKKMRSH
ncbi:MAG: type II toxin-antitoxin system ParD family antitoxin [Jaaginema sp. PMC 1080.18]|nr:type II toxin-antitoxin system ParD family antitoxin [Jaaginema sp. PMC 1080.18]